MKIKDTIWFSTGRGESIGIVLGYEDPTGKPKAYIGLGDGKDADLDTKIISEWGARLDLEFIIPMLIDHLAKPYDNRREDKV